MNRAARRMIQGTGVAMLLLAAGLLVLPGLERGRRAGQAPGGGLGSQAAPGGVLPMLGPAPMFSLTDQRGSTFSRTDLFGRVWVADFIFTRCPAICPVLSREMARLQAATAGDAALAEITRFVSFSVDPVHDTPAVLATYGRRHGADPDRWRLLTGDRETIWKMIRDGFRLLVEDTPADTANPIAHTPRLVLIDDAGEIRGMYDGTIPEEVDALEADLRRLGLEAAARK